MYLFNLNFVCYIPKNLIKSGTPRTPQTDRKFKNRSALGSDEEIEDNLSYVDESSKVSIE